MDSHTTADDATIQDTPGALLGALILIYVPAFAGVGLTVAEHGLLFAGSLLLGPRALVAPGFLCGFGSLDNLGARAAPDLWATLLTIALVAGAFHALRGSTPLHHLARFALPGWILWEAWWLATAHMV